MQCGCYCVMCTDAEDGDVIRKRCRAGDNAEI